MTDKWLTKKEFLDMMRILFNITDEEIQEAKEKLKK
jgi:hypothetical protein